VASAGPVVCTSLQRDNHTSTPPFSFALPAAQPAASKHWRQTLQRASTRKIAEPHRNCSYQHAQRVDDHKNKLSCGRQYATHPSLDRGGFTSVRGRIRSPHSSGGLAGQTDRQTEGPWHRLMPYYGGRHNNNTRLSLLLSFFGLLFLNYLNQAEFGDKTDCIYSPQNTNNIAQAFKNNRGRLPERHEYLSMLAAFTI